VSGRSMVARDGTVAMVRVVRETSCHGVVMMETGGVTTLHFQEMGRPELPPLLDVVLLSSADSLRMVCSDGNPL
jgi:hypothetical protein